MTDTEKLEAKIQESGLKKAFIAESLGLSAFGLAKKIRNETEFKAGEISKLCEILGIEDLVEKQAIFFALEVDS